MLDRSPAATILMERWCGEREREGERERFIDSMAKQLGKSRCYNSKDWVSNVQQPAGKENDTWLSFDSLWAKLVRVEFDAVTKACEDFVARIKSYHSQEYNNRVKNSRVPACQAGKVPFKRQALNMWTSLLSEQIRNKIGKHHLY